MPGGWGVKLNGFDSATDQLEAMVEAYGGMQTYTVVSGVHYAIYVEFGTSKMPANAALRGAIQEVFSNLDSVVAGASSADEITRNVADAIAAGWRRDVWVDTGQLRDSIHVEEVG